MTIARKIRTADRQAEQTYWGSGCDEVSSLAAAIRHVERVRGISIHVEALPALGDASVCGLLLVRRQRYTIFHAPASSPIHRLQCILHELGHLLLRHDESLPSKPRLGPFVPDVRLAVGDRLFGRSDLSDDEEVEAERLADLLAARVREQPQHPAGLKHFFG